MVRYTAIPGHLVLYLVIAAPFLMLAAPAALVVLAWGRWWVPAGIAGVLTAVLVAIHVPWFLSEPAPSPSVGVRIMTINMLFGHADANAVIGVAQDSADVLMVQEFTPDAARNLTAAGIEAAFPYHQLDPRRGAAGVGVYSRYPISISSRLAGYEMAAVTARVRVPHVAHDVSILTVHLGAPWPRPIIGWQSDIEKLASTLSDLSAEAGDGAVIVGGDFNSTIDMRPFRALLTNGYQDAARQAGSGRTFTYPANKWFPPLLGIDHVLTRNATAVSTWTVEVPRTDHRALLTTVMVPTT